MAHFDLPPLAGNGYMYGPQQPTEATANDVWRLLELRARRDALRTALDSLSKMYVRFVTSSGTVQQQQAARLDSCCTLLQQTLKVIQDEISEARGMDTFHSLLDEWGEE